MSDRRRPAMDARLKARRDRVAHARRQRRRRVVGSLAILVALAGTAVAVAMSPLLDIAEVRVTGVDGDRREEVRAAARVEPGENLLAADLGAADARVEELPWVRAAVVRRVPPSTVELSVAPRTPVAVVRLADGVWLVDDEAVVVAGGGDDELPLIEAPNSVLPAAGQPVRDEAVVNALTVRARLPDEIRSRVTRYEAPSARGLRLELVDGTIVRVGRAERMAEKAKAIALLLEQAASEEGAGLDSGDDAGSATAEAPGIAEIDVRAPDRPVLVPASGGAAASGDGEGAP